MKIKVLSRNPDDYQRETSKDIHKLVRNYNVPSDPFQAATEYTRALNATKLERVFAKPFLASLDGHNEGVHILSKHHTMPSCVLSGARDGEVKIWNLPTRKCVSTIQAHNGPVQGMSIDPTNGSQFVTIGQDCQLKLWKLPYPVEGDLSEPIHSIALNGVAHSVSHVANSSDFVTSGDTVDVWRPQRDSPIRTYNLGVNTVHVVRSNPIEESVLVGTASDRSVILLDTRQKSALKKVVMKLRPNAVCWNPQETYTFTVANEDYNLYSFDMRNLSHPRNVHQGHTMAVIDVDYSPTGKEFVSGSYDRTVRVFPVEGYASREVYHTKRMQNVLSVMWSSDAKFLLSGSNEMNVRVWKANRSEKMGPLNPRERASHEYQAKLRETYKEHPEIKRIARHRHVPNAIHAATKEHRIIKESAAKKQANRRQYCKDGSEDHVPEKKRHMVTSQEE